MTGYDFITSWTKSLTPWATASESWNLECTQLGLLVEAPPLKRTKTLESPFKTTVDSSLATGIALEALSSDFNEGTPNLGNCNSMPGKTGFSASNPLTPVELEEFKITCRGKNRALWIGLATARCLFASSASPNLVGLISFWIDWSCWSMFPLRSNGKPDVKCESLNG
ncbi:hypothetical protein OGAPHI_002414 [Ogataea philodendri]|uniref:Uncharacterized protein n=1 Tax=Ogataea philodendri TaxID=1378263 RepID=A0A9P8T7Z1_9ASCO|nr:uncharacterized protein OGAPHI_002414 [Ogataea philodendri]KAH3668660.1 hypothetical protein OGAPHI_002414 [Ogataea philodendri]